MPQSHARRRPATGLVVTLSIAGLGALFAPSAYAANETLWVDDTGSDTTNNCQVAADPCATVQHAVNEALDLTGDITIRIAAGDYVPEFTVRIPTDEGSVQSLTIIGAGTDDNPLVGTTLRTAVYGSFAYTAVEDSANFPVTIADLRIAAGGTPGFRADVTGIRAGYGGSLATVRGVLIEDLAGGDGRDEEGLNGAGEGGGDTIGISIGGTSPVEITNTEIRDVVGGAAGAGEGGTEGDPGGLGGDAYGVDHFGTGALTIDNSTFASIVGGAGGDGGAQSTNAVLGGAGGGGGDGAGLYVDGAAVDVTDSTFAFNAGGAGGTGGAATTAPGGAGGQAGSGAGVWVEDAGNGDLRHVTIVNNAAGPVGSGGAGGSLGAPGADAVYDAGLVIGGNVIQPSTVIMSASLLSNQVNCQVADPNLDILSDGGFNVIGVGPCPFTTVSVPDTTEFGVVFSGDNVLGALAPNPPGTTRTISIRRDSIAATAVTDGPLCEGADQRGVPRLGSPCAAGAFEPTPSMSGGGGSGPSGDGGDDEAPDGRSDGDLCGAMTTRPAC